MERQPSFIESGYTSKVEYDAALGKGDAAAAPVTYAATSAGSLYDFTCKTIDGSAKPLADFKGKPALILNVASL